MLALISDTLNEHLGAEEDWGGIVESVKMGKEIGIVVGGWDDTTGSDAMVIGTKVVVFGEGGGEGTES